MLTLAFVTLTSVLAVVQGCMTPEDLMDTLILGIDNVREAFDSLDVDNDQEITMKDMDDNYFQKEANFAKKKFLDMIDSPYDKDKTVNIKELKDFLDKKPVKLAVYGCKYIRAPTIRKVCFKDHILTYVYLVLDLGTIRTLFTSLRGRSHSGDLLCYEDITKLSDVMPSFGEADVDNFLFEVGRRDERIFKDEFEDYVLQEDLQDDFKMCRKTTDNQELQYDMKCLTTQLMEYTMSHLTELDIATFFDDLDPDQNRLVTTHEVLKSTKCEPHLAERLVKLMDMNRDHKIEYGEFRAYVKQRKTKIHLERKCTSKITFQKAQVKCYKDVLISLVKDAPFSVWMSIPNLDILFLFEELDYTHDGKLNVAEDLVDGEQWDRDLAIKMVTEINMGKEDTYVSYEKFHEFIDLPHMIYGLAKCMDIGIGIDKINCYIRRLKNMIKLMMRRQEAKAFFIFYDPRNTGYLSREEIKNKGVDEEQLDYFFRELGMGDEIVPEHVFAWFVRQDELSTMFDEKGCKTHEDYHKVLLEYLDDIMTEYDIQKLFGMFDKDKDQEISESDFLDDQTKADMMLEVTQKEEERTVTFIEFWLYLNTPIYRPRKKILEELCTSKHSKEEEEFACYKTEVFARKIEERQQKLLKELNEKNRISGKEEETGSNSVTSDNGSGDSNGPDGNNGSGDSNGPDGNNESSDSNREGNIELTDKNGVEDKNGAGDSDGKGNHITSS